MSAFDALVTAAKELGATDLAFDYSIPSAEWRASFVASRLHGIDLELYAVAKTRDGAARGLLERIAHLSRAKDLAKNYGEKA